MKMNFIFDFSWHYKV